MTRTWFSRRTDRSWRRDLVEWVRRVFWNVDSTVDAMPRYRVMYWMRSEALGVDTGWEEIASLRRLHTRRQAERWITSRGRLLRLVRLIWPLRADFMLEHRVEEVDEAEDGAPS